MVTKQYFAISKVSPFFINSQVFVIHLSTCQTSWIKRFTRYRHV